MTHRIQIGKKYWDLETGIVRKCFLKTVPVNLLEQSLDLLNERAENLRVDGKQI